MLSGYLMTLVLNERYEFTSSGLKRFLINRALRIYPPYWALLIVYIPLSILVYGNEIYPFGPYVWLKNFVIFGSSYHPVHYLQEVFISPIWSLNVELVFYLAMAFVLSRSRSITIIWFLHSLAYTTYSVVGGVEYAMRYYTLIAASLPFSTGALIYFTRKSLKRVPPILLVPVSILFIVNTFFAGALGIEKETLSFYLSVIITAGMIVALINVDVAKVPKRIKEVEGLFGDLSYPVFICHWPIAGFVLYLLPPQSSGGRLLALVITIVASVGVAAILNIFVEKRVERLRKRVRG